MAATLPKLVLLVVLLLAGCQCFDISERYGDVIDHIADRQLTLDRFYRPGLDLTRVGHDAQRACEFSQHTATYPDSVIPQQSSQEPSTPSVPPAELNVPDSPEEYSPIPPRPAAKRLPVIDTSELQEISALAAEKQAKPMPTNLSGVLNVGVSLIESTNQADSPVHQTGAILLDLSDADEFLRPLEGEKIQSPPQMSVSAPATVPPSQRFYQSLSGQK